MANAKVLRQDRAWSGGLRYKASAVGVLEQGSSGEKGGGECGDWSGKEGVQCFSSTGSCWRARMQPDSCLEC